MRRMVTLCAAVTALASGAAVLQLKLAVQEKAEQVEGLAAQIHDDREAIRVLEAEWAFLTTPRALQEKSIKFLALMPPTADQVLEDPTPIPFRPRGIEAESDPGVLLPMREEKKSKKKTDDRAKGQSL
ncbi:MAG: hypothetical protein HWE25_14825 [Alphaproteobacteria bacterium]|nr:hypothetical protein [Alphaproteobacteria bacterium]